MKTDLTADRLREVYHYEPETGVFTRRIAVGRHGRWKPGKAGSKDKFGYLMLLCDGRRYFAHRLAWLYMTGHWPTQDIDHIDREKGNNRWGNLREATNTQNMQNIGVRRDNKLGIRGVHWDNQRAKWFAQITPPGEKRKSLGRHDCLGKAIKAYRSAARQYFGDYMPSGTP